MKIFILSLLCIMAVVGVYSQSTLPLRADTVLIEKVGGSAFLKLKDSSRNTTGGILTNIGGGVYVGKKPRKSGDTLFIGKDTLVTAANVKVGNGLYKTGDTIKLGTGLSGHLDSGVILRYRANKHVSAINNQVEISNIKLDSIPGLFDPLPTITGPFNYQPTGLNVTMWYDEAANDTLMLTYGGPLKTLWWQNYDSAGTRYKQPGGATLYIPYTGPNASNRVFLPRDSVNIFSGANGGMGTMFAGDWALGGSWGYNANISSWNYPNYPLTISGMRLDLQREISRGRRRKLTGTGIAGYFWDYKDYQGNINGSTLEDSAYHSKLYGIYLAGEREGDFTVDTTTASKAKILRISKNDSVFAAYAAPMRTRSNSVYNGYGYVSAGSEDFNHLAGRLRIGGILPTQDNGGLRYNLQVHGSARADSLFSLYHRFDSTGRIVMDSKNSPAYNDGGFAGYQMQLTSWNDSTGDAGYNVPGGIFTWRVFNNYKTPLSGYSPLNDCRMYLNTSTNRNATMGQSLTSPNHLFYGNAEIHLGQNSRMATTGGAVAHTIFFARTDLVGHNGAHASGLDLTNFGGVFELLYSGAPVDSVRAITQFQDFGVENNNIGRINTYSSFRSDVVAAGNTDSAFGFLQTKADIRNKFMGTLEVPNATVVADTNNYKPVVMNTAGRVYRMAGWPGSASSSQTLQQTFNQGSILTKNDTIYHSGKILASNGQFINKDTNRVDERGFVMLTHGVSTDLGLTVSDTLASNWVAQVAGSLGLHNFNRASNGSTLNSYGGPSDSSFESKYPTIPAYSKYYRYIVLGNYTINEAINGTDSTTMRSSMIKWIDSLHDKRGYPYANIVVLNGHPSPAVLAAHSQLPLLALATLHVAQEKGCKYFDSYMYLMPEQANRASDSIHLSLKGQLNLANGLLATLDSVQNITANVIHIEKALTNQGFSYLNGILNRGYDSTAGRLYVGGNVNIIGNFEKAATFNKGVNILGDNTLGREWNLFWDSGFNEKWGMKMSNSGSPYHTYIYASGASGSSQVRLGNMSTGGVFTASLESGTAQTKVNSTTFQVTGSTTLDDLNVTGDNTVNRSWNLFKSSFNEMHGIRMSGSSPYFTDIYNMWSNSASATRLGWMASDGTTFNPVISAFQSGLVNISSLSSKVDTTTYKPLVVNSSGDIYKMGGWPISGSGGVTNINSQTGPSITIAGDQGNTVSQSSNTITIHSPYTLAYSDTSETTIANTTTQTTVLGNILGSTNINGSTITAGTKFVQKGSGILSTKTTSPGTLEFDFTISNFTLGMPLSIPANLTGVFYEYEYEITPSDVGTNKDAFYSGKITVWNNANGTISYTQHVNGRATMTTTGTLSSNVQIQWQTADTNNTITARSNSLEIKRLQ